LGGLCSSVVIAFVKVWLSVQYSKEYKGGRVKKVQQGGQKGRKEWHFDVLEEFPSLCICEGCIGNQRVLSKGCVCVVCEGVNRCDSEWHFVWFEELLVIWLYVYSKGYVYGSGCLGLRVCGSGHVGCEVCK